jgi:hypothetical protein
MFYLGMRKEWIQSEEEKHFKRIQFENKRKSKSVKRPVQVY